MRIECSSIFVRVERNRIEQRTNGEQGNAQNETKNNTFWATFYLKKMISQELEYE